MALWGSSDAASNSTIFAAAQVKVTPNTANRTALFGNTTANAFIAGVTVGQYGVDSAEIAAGGGSAAHTGWILRTAGQGGRAGRVFEETLVAGGISADAEDVAFPDYAIRILTQPSNASANASDDETATFTVSAVTVPAGGTITYLWTYANGDTIGVGETDDDAVASLVINANTAANGTSYIVELSTTGGAANVTSSSATITVTT